MTELLQRAIAEIEKLPAEVQDAVASRLLADLAEPPRPAEEVSALEALLAERGESR